jgi:hypothetical protein
MVNPMIVMNKIITEKDMQKEYFAKSLTRDLSSVQQYSFKRLAQSVLCCTVMMACAISQSAYASVDAFGDPQRAATGGQAGDLVAVQRDDKGGDVSIGATTQVVVLFRNDSNRAITFGAIQPYPSSTVSANITFNQCAREELAPGATCAVGVSIKGLSAGKWRVELLLAHSGRSRLITAFLEGQVDTGEGGTEKFISDLEAIPKELDFGSLKDAQPIVRSVVLRNITSETIDVTAVYVEAADQSGYSLRTDCSTLKPGQACVVVVTWSPKLKGQATGILLVEHTGPTTLANIELDGVFEPANTAAATSFPLAVPGKGLLVSSLENVDFGSGIATTSAITVSLVNVGDAPITLGNLNLAGGDNGVSLAANGCASGKVLEPVEACPLTVSWSPVREGAIFDDVHIQHDGARGVLVLPVRGSASNVISQDSKAVRLQSTATGSIGIDGEMGDVVVVRDSKIDPSSVLDGFAVTSHSPSRAIISGPGGSRIVYNNEEVVIGGFIWNVTIRNAGVEFRSDNDKVLLLFDRSLSTSGRSTRGGSASSSASSSSSAN